MDRAHFRQTREHRVHGIQKAIWGNDDFIVHA